MKTDYYKFFKYLYENYDLAGWVAIDKYAISVKPNQSEADVKHIKDMLVELETEGIIEWKADIQTTNEHGIYNYHWLDIPKYKSELGKDLNNTFNQIRVEVKLTRVKGIDYAEQYINSQSNISNNLWIRVLTIGLLIITALGLIVQVNQCNIPQEQLNVSLQDTLQKQNTIVPNDHSNYQRSTIQQSDSTYKISPKPIPPKLNDTTKL